MSWRIQSPIDWGTTKVRRLPRRFLSPRARRSRISGSNPVSVGSRYWREQGQDLVPGFPATEAKAGGCPGHHGQSHSNTGSVGQRKAAAGFYPMAQGVPQVQKLPRPGVPFIGLHQAPLDCHTAGNDLRVWRLMPSCTRPVKG